MLHSRLIRIEIIQYAHFKNYSILKSKYTVKIIATLLLPKNEVTKILTIISIMKIVASTELF